MNAEADVTVNYLVYLTPIYGALRIYNIIIQSNYDSLKVLTIINLF
jgi:hypothetical protein